MLIGLICFNMVWPMKIGSCTALNWFHTISFHSQQIESNPDLSDVATVTSYFLHLREDDVCVKSTAQGHLYALIKFWQYSQAPSLLAPRSEKNLLHSNSFRKTASLVGAVTKTSFNQFISLMGRKLVFSPT